jgi:ABC-type phosphate transport system substrate-binding protein
METGGAPRPGAALGLGLGLVLLAGGLISGCGESGTQDETTASARGTAPAGSGSPSPRATPPEDLCTRVVAYWSRKVLDSDTYGDYQSMGLSNGQYEILRKVVDAARPEKKLKGTQAAGELIDRRAREGCEDWYRGGGPTAGPWQ